MTQPRTFLPERPQIETREPGRTDPAPQRGGTARPTGLRCTQAQKGGADGFGQTLQAGDHGDQDILTELKYSQAMSRASRGPTSRKGRLYYRKADFISALHQMKSKNKVCPVSHWTNYS